MSPPSQLFALSLAALAAAASALPPIRTPVINLAADSNEEHPTTTEEQSNAAQDYIHLLQILSMASRVIPEWPQPQSAEVNDPVPSEQTAAGQELLRWILSRFHEDDHTLDDITDNRVRRDVFPAENLIAEDPKYSKGPPLSDEDIVHWRQVVKDYHHISDILDLRRGGKSLERVKRGSYSSSSSSSSSSSGGKSLSHSSSSSHSSGGGNAHSSSSSSSGSGSSWNGAGNFGFGGFPSYPQQDFSHQGFGNANFGSSGFGHQNFGNQGNYGNGFNYGQPGFGNFGGDMSGDPHHQPWGEGPGGQDASSSNSQSGSQSSFGESGGPSGPSGTGDYEAGDNGASEDEQGDISDGAGILDVRAGMPTRRCKTKTCTEENAIEAKSKAAARPTSGGPLPPLSGVPLGSRSSAPAPASAPVPAPAQTPGCFATSSSSSNSQPPGPSTALSNRGSLPGGGCFSSSSSSTKSGPSGT